MNWKNLGNATLITAVFSCLVALAVVLYNYCPLAVVAIAFVGVVAIIYRDLEDEENE